MQNDKIQVLLIMIFDINDTQKFNNTTKYSKKKSIENTYREAFLEWIKRHDFWDDEYVVQEKAHGANLSYWTTDGINFHAGKRTAS